MISERDILGTQLVRRNDELALLYEKIKIQQSTLNKGEFLYLVFSLCLRPLMFFGVYHLEKRKWHIFR